MRDVETQGRIAELVRILAKVAAGDHSEKPTIHEGDDEVSKFALAVRFMMDDLEAAREHERRQREELQRANEGLRQLSEMKTRFINSAAHELNTPLTPIRLQLRLLKTSALGPLTPRQASSVDMLERNLERLSHLVSDVLDAARLQSEHMRLTVAPRDVATLVRETTDTMGLAAEAQGVRLETDLARSATIPLDAHRITQVLVNLLSNALKFTPHGGSVRIETATTDRLVRIRVKDTGAGMTREQIDRLFLPFSQVHDPARHVVGGTGLGLFISKGIVEQHGGRLHCESGGPGQGTTFTVELPLHPTPTRAAVVEFPAVPRPSVT